MRSTRPAVLLVALVTLAGCFGGAGGKGDPDPTDGPMPTGDADGTLGNGTATSINSPTWTVGHSWRWQISSAAASADILATTTVLGSDGATFDVGVSDSTEGAAAYPFHLLPIGPVDAASLAWQAHGLPVSLLRFPLRDGDAFTADLWSAPSAQVTIAAAEVAGPTGTLPGFRSTASYTAGGTFVQADYAPSLGQFVRVASYFGGETPFAEATLLGEVGPPESPVAFRVTDLARVSANAGDPASLAPRALTIPPGADLAMLACFLPGTTGAYGAELSGAGTPSACVGQGTGSTEFHWATGTAEAGPATLTITSAGQDGATIEAFAVDTTTE